MKRLKGAPIARNYAIAQVLQWFFAYPEQEVGLNELAQTIGIAKTTANKTVRALAKAGHIEVKQIGRMWRIKATQAVTEMKIGFHLMKLCETSILEQIQDLYPSAQAIILFGSYRKGDDTERSDIDIAVEVLGDKPSVLQELGTLPELGYRRNIKVNLFVFSRSKVDLNMFANIANGIVLSGFLEVRP